MNQFTVILGVIILSSAGLVLSELQDDEDFVETKKLFNFPNILWSVFDVLNGYSACHDLKILSVPAQVYSRQKKIHITAEIPEEVGSKFSQAQLRLEFHDVAGNLSNISYLADIGAQDKRIPALQAQEAEDTLAFNRDVEMSFSVTHLLRTTVQLRRKHFSAHLKITPGKKLLKANSLKVFLIIQQNDTTCSDFALPKLKAGSSFHLNVSDPAGGPSPCRIKSHVVAARDVTTAFFNVLRPALIDIGSCEGRCDLGRGWKSYFSNHAALRARHAKEGGKGRLLPCCAPSAYQPVLLMGQEHFSQMVSILEVPNMRFSSCACM